MHPILRLKPNILRLAFLIPFLLPSLAQADACIFDNSTVKCLRPGVSLFDNTLGETLSRIVTGDDDPRVTSTFGETGSLYLQGSTGGGSLYQKQDDGNTTNWTQVGGGSSSGGGDVTGGANVGVGTGLTFRDKIAGILNFRSLLQGGSTQISTVGNEVTISSSASENVTAQNFGAGVGAFISKIGSVLGLKTFGAGGSTTVSDSSNVITYTTPASEIAQGQNLGSGAGVFSGKVNNVLQFFGIKGAGSTSVSQSGNDIQISTASSQTSPGGVNKDVQFNFNGNFGGDHNFVWDRTNKRLGIGTATPTHALSIAGTASDQTASFLIQTDADGETTTNGSFENYGIRTNTYHAVRAGITDSGQAGGMVMNALRNFSTIHTNDSGTLANIYAMAFQYGHYNNNALETPQTTNAYGLFFGPYGRTGTITNMYDMFMQTKSGGGTITNHWGIYQQDPAIRNFLGSKLGIANDDPKADLHLGDVGHIGTMKLAGSTSGSVTIQPQANAGNWTLKLPTNDGSSGQILSTDGNGLASWSDASSTAPAPPVNSVQFNNAGSFGGEDSLTWDRNSKILYNAGSTGMGITNPNVKFHVSLDGSRPHSSLYDPNTTAFLFTENGAHSFGIVLAAGTNSGMGLSRANTSLVNPSSTNVGDILGIWSNQGYLNGQGRGVAVRMDGVQDNTGVASGQFIPGRWVLNTTSTAGTLTERMRVNSNGAVGFGFPTDFGTAGYVLTSSASTASPVWAPASGGGEVNTASNIGPGTGFFQQKVVSDLQFRGLRGASSTIVRDDGDVVTVNTSPAIGEVNTIRNRGPGLGLSLGKIDAEMQLATVDAAGSTSVAFAGSTVTLSTTNPENDSNIILSGGRAGGQVIHGGATGTNGDLRLESTAAGTKGNINFGTFSQYRQGFMSWFFGKATKATSAIGTGTPDITQQFDYIGDATGIGVIIANDGFQQNINLTDVAGGSVSTGQAAHQITANFLTPGGGTVETSRWAAQRYTRNTGAGANIEHEIQVTGLGSNRYAGQATVTRNATGTADTWAVTLPYATLDASFSVWCTGHHEQAFQVLHFPGPAKVFRVNATCTIDTRSTTAISGYMNYTFYTPATSVSFVSCDTLNGCLDVIDATRTGTIETAGTLGSVDWGIRDYR